MMLLLTKDRVTVLYVHACVSTIILQYLDGVWVTGNYHLIVKQGHDKNTGIIQLQAPTEETRAQLYT